MPSSLLIAENLSSIRLSTLKYNPVLRLTFDYDFRPTGLSGGGLQSRTYCGRGNIEGIIKDSDDEAAKWLF